MSIYIVLRDWSYDFDKRGGHTRILFASMEQKKAIEKANKLFDSRYYGELPLRVLKLPLDTDLDEDEEWGTKNESKYQIHKCCYVKNGEKEVERVVYRDSKVPYKGF